MKAKDLRKFDRAELLKRLEQQSQELSDLYLDVKTGKEKNYKTINDKKKQIARILTVLKEVKKKA